MKFRISALLALVPVSGRDAQKAPAKAFWRWQTQRLYTPGFNAIMNWNDLDAGKTAPSARGTTAARQQ